MSFVVLFFLINIYFLLRILLQKPLSNILTAIFNLKKYQHQLQGDKQYVCGYTDHTANISSEVTDLA